MRISEVKKEKISEQILAFLFSNSPKPIFTSHIAIELARDEEFIKKLLIDLKDKKLVHEITKNSQGKIYSRRKRWKLSDGAYRAYKHNQNHY
jgi:hypothetical protein